ncbi:ECF transporter S component [Clostridium estertheticum]|uniref:Riboflavin transporter n=1 Tax=Clostridium estertheticum subsp. estertheticum TaxID=1552 RepID=A0A1J0GBZ1_9CLOT|nr:ECF transporter S component [Clostridium estertheticum]APC38807.1 ECF transporter S component [Clostridium estertheticum subsp. estertheticum]MBU3074578.1 ECF transporter S component [Clostridium estertheticum]MBU3164710.1 ECF transporter S component [Clostridium estertheticum]MBU3171310.1 ECF transporter S component [Clostridium estertheticum]MBU3185701.1 ECF transporter S component [Clostridium estertheticum]
MRNEKLIKMIKITLLSVMAFLLMYIELPIPIFPDFLKIDISDLPALLGAFALGPIAGVLIELFKNILHGFLASKTAFVGEFANFLVGSVLILVSGYIYKLRKNKSGAIIGLLVGTIVMSVFAAILNYFVVLPLYETVLGFPITAVVAMGSKINHNITDLNSFIIWMIIPFNIFKGIVLSVMTLALYKSVSPILHKEHIESKYRSKQQNY